MKIKNKLTPYPILSLYNDDYLNSSFEVDIEVECKFSELLVDVKFKLNDLGLNQLILDGLAVYAVHVECPTTSFRKKYDTNQTELSFRITTDNLKEKVEICCYIVACSDILNYYNNNFHSDYDGIYFNIEKGNILAIGTGKDVTIIKNNDDLENLPSIIKICPIKDLKKGTISVDTDDSNYILVGIYEGIIEKYYELGKNKYKNTIMTLILLPVIELVLLRMKDADEEEKEKKWYKVIENLLNQNGIEVEDLDIQNKEKSVLAIAQNIFADPISRSFEELERTSLGGCNEN